jgi:ring-1,2-phenylacetyl-CoA epoxidase subunit PaaD
VSAHPLDLDREDVLELLEEVKDPEVPVLSVVELGIVRDVRVDGSEVTVVVTPTYSGCPAMRVIEEEIVDALRARGIDNARVETAYAPAWTTDWLTEDAKRKLEAYGIAPPGPAPKGMDLGVLVAIEGRRERPRCPYCASSDTELRSEFGSTACKSICYCRACRQPFEQFKAI